MFLSSGLNKYTHIHRHIYQLSEAAQKFGILVMVPEERDEKAEFTCTGSKFCPIFNNRSPRCPPHVYQV